MRLIRTALALAALSLPLASATAQVWRSDQGDGTYRNPVLYADYPDPDIIRVGEDFYFVTTTFANVPGMTILHSRDLINWTIASHVIQTLDGPDYDLRTGSAYRKGIFAASMRHHRGEFFIAVTPVGHNTRIYRARDVRGPWTMTELDRAGFDPALHFDADGTGYIVSATGADGTLTLYTLDADYARVVASERIGYIQGAEGSKIVRRGDWLYLFNAIPRRLGLTVSRARSIKGPWETRNQIDDTTGGHQGALVDLADGTHVGFVMVDAGAIGRMTNISPVHWIDGWPVWGTPDAPGRVPERAAKPVPGHPLAQPPADDDFSAPRLGLQWQWNHNPLNDRWSLTDRPGHLRLRATKAPELWLAPNTLTQKAQGPRSRAEAVVDVSALTPGDRCGLTLFGKYSGGILAGRNAAGETILTMDVTEDQGKERRLDRRITAPPIRADRLWLRIDMDFTSSKALAAYSADGAAWQPLGGTFPMAFDWRTGTFQGEQIALACYNPKGGEGRMDVDSFRLMPGPAVP